MDNIMLKSELLTLSEVNELEKEAYKNWNKTREAVWVGFEHKKKHPIGIIQKTAKKIIDSMANDFGKEIKYEYGLEFWININKQQGLHCDCDETLRKKAGVMRYPICSSVYYLKVPLEGGDLVIHERASHETINKIYTSKSTNYALGRSINIKPQFNQLVIFEPKRPHYVEPWKFNAERISIAANLWAEKPADSKRPFEKVIKQLQAENRAQCDRK